MAPPVPDQGSSVHILGSVLSGPGVVGGIFDIWGGGRVPHLLSYVVIFLHLVQVPPGMRNLARLHPTLTLRVGRVPSPGGAALGPSAALLTPGCSFCREVAGPGAMATGRGLICIPKYLRAVEPRFGG